MEKMTWWQKSWPSILVLIGLIICIILLVLFLAACTRSYQFRYRYTEPAYTSTAYDYEEKDYGRRNYRDADELDDWTERGNASVEASPIFRSGLRLKCNGTKEEPTLAAAIYRFRMPSTVAFKVRIYYKDISRDNKVAAKVFVRTEKDKRQEAVIGDTFLLRTEQMSETFHLSRSRYEIGGMIEVHIVAQDRDVVEIRKIQLEPAKKKPQIRIVKKYYSRNYWRQYPRYRYVYHYYYHGPYYWPSERYSYIRWTWHSSYYWKSWRPRYRSWVKVYVKKPRWQRSYVSVYDDPPVSYDDPVRLRNRRKRVSRSVVKRSRRRSHSERLEETKNSADFQKERHISQTEQRLKHRRKPVSGSKTSLSQRKTSTKKRRIFTHHSEQGEQRKESRRIQNRSQTQTSTGKRTIRKKRNNADDDDDDKEDEKKKRRRQKNNNQRRRSKKRRR